MTTIEEISVTTKYAIRREKGFEHICTMTINPFGGQTATTKHEPEHYINTRGRNYYTNNQSSRDVGVDSMKHKMQEDSNNGTQHSTPINKSKKVAINTVEIINKHSQQKNKFFSKCAKPSHFAKVRRSANITYVVD